jgi:tetratricopeptide (TPR) repeat protein
MKKIVSIVLALILFVGITNAQKIEDGRKYLSFQKNKSALNVFQSIYNSNTKNAEAIYWYGQALLANDNIADAKSLYQKALQDGVNEPLIWIGAAHVELAENGDLNSAKQKFEQAITASTPTKGKRKNKPDTEILNAIGRANAYGSSKIGDPNYGIEKLSLAIQNDENANAEVYINLGKCYQKLGGENGGEAVKAYTTAIAKNPAYAEAHWRIGLIYASQDNKEMYEKYYNDAIAANAEFPPVYLSYYRVY